MALKFYIYFANSSSIPTLKTAKNSKIFCPLQQCRNCDRLSMFTCLRNLNKWTRQVCCMNYHVLWEYNEPVVKCWYEFLVLLDLTPIRNKGTEKMRFKGEKLAKKGNLDLWLESRNIDKGWQLTEDYRSFSWAVRIFTGDYMHLTVIKGYQVENTATFLTILYIFLRTGNEHFSFLVKSMAISISQPGFTLYKTATFQVHYKWKGFPWLQMETDGTYHPTFMPFVRPYLTGKQMYSFESRTSISSLRYCPNLVKQTTVGHQIGLRVKISSKSTYCLSPWTKVYL